MHRDLTLKALRDQFVTSLKAIYSKEESLILFYRVTEALLSYHRADVALHLHDIITEGYYIEFIDVLKRLQKHEPIQYILSKTEFYGSVFEVSPAVLIPRPETEELVDRIIKTHKGVASLRILDLCTGSGCIAITLAKSFPNAHVTAIDISQSALNIAKKNAQTNQVNIQWIQKDVLKLEGFKEQYDIIVSNPPYVRNSEKVAMAKNVLAFEPSLALFVEDQQPLIFYDQIARLATISLRSSGHLYFEINQYLGEATKNILIKYGFKNIKLTKDLNLNDRMLSAQL